MRGWYPEYQYPSTFLRGFRPQLKLQLLNLYLRHLNMPSTIPTDPLPKWQRPSPTKHNLPWADIAIIDLSTFDKAGGKEKLAEELRDAVRTHYQNPQQPP